MSRASQDIGAFGKGMLTKLRPFCTDAHRRNQIGRPRRARTRRRRSTAAGRVMAMPELARRRSSRARQRFEHLMHAQQKFIRLTHLQQGLAADACATESPAPDVQATDLRNREAAAGVGR